jgi:broad specificity phosphatase PhoE
LTDLPLTERGERNARWLGKRLQGMTFAKVFTSPLQRAARTCLARARAPVTCARRFRSLLSATRVSALSGGNIEKITA